MKGISLRTLALLIGLSLPFAASAAASGDHASSHSVKEKPENVTTAAAATATLSDGEVKKIDKDAGKITIKHGPLANLGMPGMTMVFRVKDIALLEQIKPGDKISFNAERVNGQFVVTQLEVKK